LQRPDHRSPHPTRAAGRALSTSRRRDRSAASFADLWSGRADRPLRGNQADRHGARRHGTRLRRLTMILTSLRMLLALTLLTGVLYPLAATAIGRAVFPRQAEGSLLTRDGHVVGSALIGQPFSSSRYFWGRPSATSPPYNGAASTGSNLG